MSDKISFAEVPGRII